MRQGSSDYAESKVLDFHAIARNTLTVLARDIQRPEDGILLRFMARLYDVIVADNLTSLNLLLASMRRAGIRDEDITDFYAPVIARQLGHAWTDDRLSFVQVSNASARLQNLLHRLDMTWFNPLAFNRRAVPGEICLFVPQGVQHTLGATVLAGQLRRAGCLVRMALDLQLEDISNFVRQPDTAGVLISASRAESLGFLEKVVEKVRDGDAKVPVLLGGNVLDRKEDVAAAIGADYSTSNWQDALTICKKRTVR
jgi:methanogenic corrinoid protein MtbC1